MAIGACSCGDGKGKKLVKYKEGIQEEEYLSIKANKSCLSIVII